MKGYFSRIQTPIRSSMVEQLPLKELVVGSSPTGWTLAQGPQTGARGGALLSGKLCLVRVSRQSLQGGQEFLGFFE